MSITLTALMKQRYDTAANWTAQNPTLLAGEFGIESDTKRWKVGTGSTAWTSLLYSNGGTYPLVNADIAANAEIAVSKLADGSARQLLQTDAAGTGVEWTSDVSIPGVLVTPAGTVTANGIQVGTGTTYKPGIYSPGADQLAISTGGTGRLFVSSVGLVGIGTSGPALALGVKGATGYPATSGTSQTGVLRISGGTGIYNVLDMGVNEGTDTAWIQATRANSLAVNDKLVINPNGGNVGIGTNSPGSALEINAAAATSPFIAKINTAEKARIDSSGRLLVGGSSDSGGALLQVFGDRIRIGTAKTPASASATGTAGEICWDANYIYVCTATNTWKRTAIATW